MPPTTDPARSFKVDASCGRVDCSAGANPKISPVANDTAAVKPSTVPSGVLESVKGVLSVGRKLISALTMTTARPRPAAPPMIENTAAFTSG